MSRPGSWWKNSTILLMLLSVPLVIASIPPSPMANVPSPAEESSESPDMSDAVARASISTRTVELAQASTSAAEKTPAESQPAAPPEVQPAAPAESPPAAPPEVQPAAPAESPPAAPPEVQPAAPAESPPAEPVVPTSPDVVPVVPTPSATEKAPPVDAVATVPTSDATPSTVESEQSVDPELAGWQRDVEERIRKAAMSEILVALGENHSDLDDRVIAMEKMEQEVRRLRQRLEYLEKLKAEWDQHAK